MASRKTISFEPAHENHVSTFTVTVKIKIIKFSILLYCYSNIVVLCNTLTLNSFAFVVDFIMFTTIMVFKFGKDQLKQQAHKI